MKLETITGGIIDTDKMNDISAEMFEMVVKSGIREFVTKHNGGCYILTFLPKNGTFSHMHLDSKDKLNYFLQCVNELFMRCNNNEFRLVIAPNKPKE
jgi:hypothetical protein